MAGKRTPPPTIINFDELLPDDLKKNYMNPPEWFAPRHPFLACMVARSGGGKSNLLLNLIYRYSRFSKIWMFVADIEEDKYIMLQRSMMAIHKAMRNTDDDIDRIMNQKPPDDNPLENIFVLTNDLSKIPSADDIDTKKQHLFVFDDMISFSQAQQKKITDLFIRGRKRNASSIYISQSYSDIPPIIRKNCNYIILFHMNRRGMIEMAKTFASDIEFHTFKHIFKDATAEPFSFLMIDLKNKKYKYRKGLDQIYSVDDVD